MIVIEIDSQEFMKKSGIAKSTGEAYTMCAQQCTYSGTYIDGFPSKLPRESSIQLDSLNPQPYPPGKYVIAADTFFWGDFNKLAFGRVKLQPLAQFLAEIKKQFAASDLKAA